MDPNSQHQLWSKWTFTVTPGDRRKAGAPLVEVRLNCARFGRQIFGSAGSMNVERLSDQRGPYWRVMVLVEGHPVHDPSFRENVLKAWARFFRNGFGPGTHTHLDTKEMAGDFENGRPPDQLIILPPVRLFDEDSDERKSIS